MKQHFYYSVTLALVFISGPLFASNTSIQKRLYKEGEVLVKYRHQNTVLSQPFALKSTHLGASISSKLRLLELPGGKSVEDVVALLRQDPNVEFAEPNYLVRKTVVPDDTRFDDQWALTNIAATSAWDLQTGSTDIVVAVLDTGIDYNHADLAPNLWQNSAELSGIAGEDDDANGIVDDIWGVSYNGATVTGDPLDDDTADAHGTHVSGIIGAAGNNAQGVSGVNWSTRVMAVKILHGPLGLGSMSDIIKGIGYAISNNANVINLSFDFPGYSNALESTIDDADANGVLVVSAAGNSGVDLDQSNVSPASIRSPNNIAVAAMTVGDTLPSFSNYGHTTVDVAAPGGAASYTVTGILSTMSPIAGNGDYNYLAGTSMAAPHVSGLAALVWSQFPTLDHHQVKARILNSIDAVPELETKTISGGRINAYNALINPDSAAIFRVTPSTVAAGGQVTITGANFGAATGTVTLGSTGMQTVSWDSSGKSIVAAIPLCIDSGEVRVNGEGNDFPLTVTDKQCLSEGDRSSDSRCFIATAAYGSHLHPKVSALRRFRDEYLLSNKLGKKLVNLYYRISPPLAGFIRESAWLKQATIWVLTPVVFGAEKVLALSAKPPARKSDPVSAPAAESTHEILLKFKAHIPENRRLEILKEAGAVIQKLSRVDVYHLRFADSRSAEKRLKKLADMPEIEYAEPNWQVRKSRPSDRTNRLNYQPAPTPAAAPLAHPPSAPPPWWVQTRNNRRR